MNNNANDKPVLGTPEYNAHMEKIITEHDKQAGIQPTEPEREEWLPEGFNSREELLADYEKLKAERAAEQHRQEPEEPSDEGAPEVLATREQAVAYLKTKGLDVPELEREYLDTGKLSDDAYKKLAKAGFPRAFVDDYLQGLRAVQEQARSEVMTLVGGEDSYKELVSWAAKTLTQQEIDAYNRVMSSGDLDAIKMTVSGLAMRHKGAVSDPQLIMGKTASPVSGAAYETDDEIVAAMRDPRYKNDPAYRRQVQRRVMNSKTL